LELWRTYKEGDMFARGLRIAIMLLLLLGGGVFPRIGSPPSTSHWAQAKEQGIRCEVLQFGIGVQNLGLEVLPPWNFKADLALVFKGALHTPKPLNFLIDAAIVTDRGFTKRSLLGVGGRSRPSPDRSAGYAGKVKRLAEWLSPVWIQVDLSRVERAAYAGGIAVFWDRRIEDPIGICSVLTGAQTFDLPAARRMATSAQRSLDLILFVNDAALVLPQHRGSLLLGFNTGPLWVEGNTGEITVGFNLGPQVPLPNGSQGAGRIEIANNTGSIRLGSNFGLVTIHSNEGVILIEANRPFGRVIVEGNRGTIRLLENQGEIEDPTGTVDVGRSD